MYNVLKKIVQCNQKCMYNQKMYNEKKNVLF